MPIQVKRIYEPYAASDGFRILIDRLWPRGINKDKAHIDIWLKEVAPSTELRKWFDHDPAKQKEFEGKYYAEIKDSAALKELERYVAEHEAVTFLFAARDEEHNHALVLRRFISGHS